MSSDRPHVDGLPTRIRLIEQIGRGSSATVWLARDTEHGSDLAVKLLTPVPGVDGELRAARLEREGRALARLADIDGVVALREMGRAADGTAWLVMDLAQPESLRERLTRVSVAESDGRSRAVGDAAALAVALATTLAHAHARGVVHGDIAPANVLFDESGAPMLADFGMAVILGGGDGAQGVAGFTPAYAAPERLRGGPPDGPSDVYSLAATVSEVAATAGATPAQQLVDALDAALAAAPAQRPTAAEFAVLLGGGGPRRRLGRRR